MDTRLFHEFGAAADNYDLCVASFAGVSADVVDERDLDHIARSLGSVYEHADFVGSLAIPQGDPWRPTD